MPMRIITEDSYPRQCKCGSGGFFVIKETEKYRLWKCVECGRTQKIKTDNFKY